MKKEDFKKYKLPEKPGVYFFLDKKGSNSSFPKKENILYIGKATSLKDRVGSYFSSDLINTRGVKIRSMVENAKGLFFVETSSVLEAIILESKYIKKYSPFFNTKEKDDKSHSFIVITKEEFPRVLIMREKEIDESHDIEIGKRFGPFVSKAELVSIMKILRKIFPYRDKCKTGEKRGCFNYQIGLCPGVCIGKISKTNYAKNIKALEKILDGDTKSILKSLEKEMKKESKEKKFEEAGKIRDKIFSLNHLNDLSLIKTNQNMFKDKNTALTLESFDVAHISGSYRVGVMCRFEIINGELEYKKSEYKKFKLSEKVNDDLGGLEELLKRRFKHSEWSYPDIVVIDGGKTHLNFARKFIEYKNIKLVSVVKDDKHRAREVLYENLVEKSKNQDYNRFIILANLEAHRFAISYHKFLRNKIKKS
ncbi:MAG: UvrB/UvrC motif-containing protein [Candidatus Paceibacterota bacterium]|jgi:excinuclease ABC subunit C